MAGLWSESNREGVIQLGGYQRVPNGRGRTYGSRTNHPPMFTPLTFSDPHAKATPRLELWTISKSLMTVFQHAVLPALAVHSCACIPRDDHGYLRRSRRRGSTSQSDGQKPLQYHDVTIVSVRIAKLCGMMRLHKGITMKGCSLALLSIYFNTTRCFRKRQRRPRLDTCSKLCVLSK